MKNLKNLIKKFKCSGIGKKKLEDFEKKFRFQKFEKNFTDFKNQIYFFFNFKILKNFRNF